MSYNQKEKLKAQALCAFARKGGSGGGGGKKKGSRKRGKGQRVPVRKALKVRCYQSVVDKRQKLVEKLFSNVIRLRHAKDIEDLKGAKNLV